MGRHDSQVPEKEELLARVLPRLAVVKGPDPRGEHLAWCVFHPDGKGKPPHQPNLQVSVRGFICHACGKSGSLRELARELGVLHLSGDGSDVSYDYPDESGKLLFQVVRRPPKQFLQRRPGENGGWVWNTKGIRKVLFNLPMLLDQPAGDVFIVEGEKDAVTLVTRGVLATTNPGGAGKWKKEYSELLKGRSVVILPDNDESGRRHARVVADSLRGHAASIKIVELPGLPEKGDVSDWLGAGHTLEELSALARSQEPYGSNAKDAGTETSNKGDNKASRLVKLVRESNLELFHDERGEPYARIAFPEGRRIISLGSAEFRRWMSHLAYKEMGETMSRESLASAQLALAGLARFEGEQHPLHVRTAWLDEAIWLDLDGSRSIRIVPGEWTVIDDPPILFRSFPHQKPLPRPIAGGDPRRVLRYVNLGNEESKLLFLSYLVVSLVPDIPIAAIVIHGVQGSAKTTLLRIVKSLIDPSVVDIRGSVRDLNEFALTAFQNRVILLDNLTSIPDWMSDALCRAVSGEGYSKRLLYTDDDTVVFRYRRVIGFSGINLVADRADLLDRSLILALEPIGPEQRLVEADFWRDFEEERASIFGGLLDALARAMGVRGRLRHERLPRMADFASWGAAAAAALGRTPVEFIRAFERNVGRQNEAAVEASPVAQALVELMKDRSEWDGSPAGLFRELDGVADRLGIDVKDKMWPKTPSWVTRRIREVFHNLLAMGIRVEDERTADGRLLRIRKSRGDTVIADRASAIDPYPAAGAEVPLKGQGPVDLPASDGDPLAAIPVDAMTAENGEPGNVVGSSRGKWSGRVGDDGNDTKPAVASGGGPEGPNTREAKFLGESSPRSAVETGENDGEGEARRP